MSLQAQLASDLKDAMRARDERRLLTIRSLRAAIASEEMSRAATERTAAQHRLAAERGVAVEDIAASELPASAPLEDADVLKVVGREIKKRQDSIEQYRKVGRDDAADAEAAEIAILQAYMPPQLSADALRPLVQAVITEVGATSKADLKKVMPVVMSRYRDQADGRTLNQVVQELLGS